jgi:hypothetical protein
MFLSFSTLVYTFKLPEMVQNILKLTPGGSSPIPQFMLDMESSWLDANKNWLDKYPDVQNALCSKDSALWREGAEARTPPEDLFSKINIDNNKAGVSRPGWLNAKDRLTEIRACAAALDGARHLHVDVYIHNADGYDNILQAEPNTPSSDLATLFAEVLANMRNLERLDFGVSAAATPVFEKAFVDANLTLPSVKYLVPGKYSHWLVPMCPNLEVLVTGGYFNHWSWNHYDPNLNQKEDAWVALIEATKGSPLKEFTLRSGDWSPDLLNRKCSLA